MCLMYENSILLTGFKMSTWLLKYSDFLNMLTEIILQYVSKNNCRTSSERAAFIKFVSQWCHNNPNLNLSLRTLNFVYHKKS